MRLLYNTNGFAHHRLEDVLDVLADLGYDGVALTPDVQHLDPVRATGRAVEKLRRRLEQLRLGVTIEGGARFLLDPRRKHHPTLLSSDGYRLRQRFYLRLIDLAVELGSPLVSIWSGRAEEDTPPGDAALALLAERLAPVLEHAAARGIALCFEPEPGMLVDRIDGFEALRARCGGLPLWLTIDTGHLVANEAPPEAAHVARGAPWLRNVHVDDAPRGVHEHRCFGEGDLDLPGVAAALREIGFEGPVAVELSRHSHDAVAVARNALQALRAAGF